MERQDIISGLRNAVERGYSIELAVQSFINAGYSRQDVLDSAKVLGYNSSIISNLPQTQQETSQAQQIMQSSQAQQYSTPQTNQPAPTSSQAKVFPPVPQPRQTQQPQQQSQQSQQPQSRQLYAPLPSSQPQQVQIEKKNWFAENWLILLLSILLLLLVSGLFVSIFAKDWLSSLLGLS